MPRSPRPRGIGVRGGRIGQFDVHHGPVGVGFCEVGAQFDGLRVVLEGRFPVSERVVGVASIKVRVGVARVRAYSRVVVEYRFFVPVEFREGPAAVVVYVAVHAGGAYGRGEVSHRLFVAPGICGRRAAPVVGHGVLGGGDVDGAGEGFGEALSESV